MGEKWLISITVPGAILRQLMITAAATQTGQIVFQEDRSSAALEYISVLVSRGWSGVFASLTAAGCVVFAVWMAKNRKKRKQP